ncbi:hypothetical protein ACH4OW_22710 [Streptomyces sp. NPDC017056]|uniref:hypothetical protein n=1 Tax=Streptomyces sp. NPDC017056 TaxID=3364973 RepID=UPI0037ACC29F
MDLLDWHRGRLSARRLSVLLAHLPRDGAVARALHDEAAEWSVTDHLLATVADHLAVANWMFATVNRDEDTEPLEYPEPLRRPGAGPEGESGAVDDGAQAAASGAAAPAGDAAGPSAAELIRFFS